MRKYTTGCAGDQPLPATTSDRDQPQLAEVGASGGAQRQGLVYYQQSSRAGTAPSQRLSKGRDPGNCSIPREQTTKACEGRTSGCKGRWRVYLTSEEQDLVIDTHQMRLARCQQRVFAWATALPKGNRRARRASAKKKIGPRMVMLTLTYKEASDWRTNQIRDFMVDIRNLLGEKLYAYAWVLEMQERGAPHYHVLLYLERGVIIPRPDDGMWKHGMSRIETVKTPYYICKYTGKKKQKAYQKEGLPSGARMFAVKIYSSDVPLDELFVFTISSAPKWLRPYLIEAYNRLGRAVKWSRIKGGGWVIRDTGEVYYSPWSIVAIERVE